MATYTEFPRVSVIVSHLNSARTIANCLSYLEKVDYPRERFEVIVVDAGSTDGSREIVKQPSNLNVRQIVREGCTEAEGQSLGVQKSEGDVIMFTNSDIYVPRDWIKKHVSWLRKGYDLSGGAVFWSGDKFALTWNLPLPNRPFEKLQPGLGLGFSNCSINRDFFVKAGGLRDLRSQHDAEFVLRSMKMGGKLVMDPDMQVYHDHPFRSFLGNFKRSFGYAINHVTVIKASFGRMVAGSGSPIIFSVSSLYKEITLITSARAYKQFVIRTSKWKAPVRVSFFEFALLRLFSTKAGQLFGILAGALPGRKNLSSILELHSSKPKM